MFTHWNTGGSDAHDEEGRRAARRHDRGNRTAVLDAVELERMACHASALEQYPLLCRVWRGQLYEAARRARSAGLHAYSSLSLRIGEQIKPSLRSSDLPRWAVELLLSWCQASLRYLRHTAEFGHATELVDLLRMSPSRDCYGAEERACLLHYLVADPGSVAQCSAEQAAEPGSGSAGTL